MWTACSVRPNADSKAAQAHALKAITVEIEEWSLFAGCACAEDIEYCVPKEPKQHEVRLLFWLPDDRTEREIFLRCGPLGARFGSTSPLVVLEIRKGSEAQAHGIRPGWLLLEINERRVMQLTAQECCRALGKLLQALPQDVTPWQEAIGKAAPQEQAQMVTLTGPVMPCEGLRGNFLAGAVLAQNGKVYCAPSGAGQVLCVDPLRRTVEQLGPWLEGEAKYRATGVLAPNGSIYFAPCCACKVLRVDTETDTVHHIGPDLDGGSHKYLAGGVLARDGKIYFAPAGAQRVLCVDPHTDQVEMLGPSMEGSGKFQSGGVLAGNGKIYFAPSMASRVLCIDPASSSTEMMGQVLPGKQKYVAAGVLARDGRIYFAPADAKQVLRVDPCAGACQLVGPELQSERNRDLCGVLVHKYIAGGVLARDGRIFFPPGWACRLLCVDPAAGSVEMCGPRFEALNICAHYQSAGVVAPNGSIFFAPLGALRVLRIDPEKNLVQMVGEELPDRYMRGKFAADGALASDGRIYCPPNFADRTLSIDPEGFLDPSFSEEGTLTPQTLVAASATL